MAISCYSQVLSGAPRGTVLVPLLLLIMLANINKYISESNLISFAHDTRIYTNIDDVTDCNTLQQGLNHVYDWASANNIFCNALPLVLIHILVCQMYIYTLSTLSQLHLLMYLILVCKCLEILILIFMLQMYIRDAPN